MLRLQATTPIDGRSTTENTASKNRDCAGFTRDEPSVLIHLFQSLTLASVLFASRRIYTFVDDQCVVV